ncbi:hypothetical protein [Streptomyces sp. NPDC059134]|uniref:hypothetical protein n=1 Tax=Streptomyces sp. NPDC059134 TaxID=3346738 RepID=UPI0036A8D3E0
MREQPPRLRITDAFRQSIAEQEWTPGDRRPSPTWLAKECKAGKNVVRHAQEPLISLRVLEGRTPYGLPGYGPRAGTGVEDCMIGIAVSHVVEQPDLGHVDAEKATLLGARRSALVTRIRRTRYAAC